MTALVGLAGAAGLAVCGFLAGYAHGVAQRARATAEAYDRGVWDGRRAERKFQQREAAHRRDGW